MAAKPPLRQRKTTDCLVAQAAAGETATRPADAPWSRNWNVRLPGSVVERSANHH